MSFSRFVTKKHIFPGQHVRYYAGATRYSEEDTIWLEAKQYIPIRNNQVPCEGGVTNIGHPGISYPKEIYEPLWDDLLDESELRGFHIRSIWIADASSSGGSGVLNEHIQGDDPSFFDTALDLLQMINTFRGEIPQPLIGIGHSQGATTLIHLSLLHPRLLTSLVLLDPMIGSRNPPAGMALLYMAAIRPDKWPSQEEAEQYFRFSTSMRAWNPRVQELYLRYGLRETPTLLYPKPGEVTLRTTKAQEAWTYGRSCFDALPASGQYEDAGSKIKYPDTRGLNISDTHPFYRTVGQNIWHDLARLRPSVMFLFPETAALTQDVPIADKLVRTGLGVGGSGGEKEGRVSHAVIDGTGHLIPFEKPVECARSAAVWIGREVEVWRQRTEFERSHRDDKSVGMVALSREWTRRAREAFVKSTRGGSGGSKL